MLLEHSLAGVLAGAATVLGGSTPSGTSGGASSPRGQPASVAKGNSAALETRLALSLGSDATGAPKVTSGSPADAISATAAGAATAALSAAQLAAGSHIGLQQARAAPPSAALTSPVGSSAWTDELGTRLTWMAHQGIESASLQLSPEHLGPLQVRISVHDGQASVWFGAAQPDTRTALQQALPQLRQLFANQGLTLADAGVSRESPRGQSQQNPARTAAPVSVAAVNSDGSAGRALSAVGLGLVDTYV